MRKAQVVALTARRCGLRETRLTSLVQRLSDAELLPVSKGPPYVDLSPVEIARILIVGLVDEGLAAAPKTAAKYGGLLGPGSTFEESLGHSLARPETFVPSRSGLEIHSGSDAHAVLTLCSADGPRSLVFATSLNRKA